MEFVFDIISVVPQHSLKSGRGKSRSRRSSAGWLLSVLKRSREEREMLSSRQGDVFVCVPH